jgi:hypothetical protein
MTPSYAPRCHSSTKMHTKMPDRNARVATDAPSVPVRAQLDRHLPKSRQRARSRVHSYFCRDA